MKIKPRRMFPVRRGFALSHRNILSVDETDCPGNGEMPCLRMAADCGTAAAGQIAADGWIVRRSHVNRVEVGIRGRRRIAHPANAVAGDAIAVALVRYPCLIDVAVRHT